MHYLTLWLLEIVLAFLPALFIYQTGVPTGQEFLVFSSVLFLTSAINILNISISQDNNLLKRFGPSAFFVSFLIMSFVTALTALSGRTIDVPIGLATAVGTFILSGITLYGLNHHISTLARHKRATKRLENVLKRARHNQKEIIEIGNHLKSIRSDGINHPKVIKAQDEIKTQRDILEAHIAKIVGLLPDADSEKQSRLSQEKYQAIMLTCRSADQFLSDLEPYIKDFKGEPAMQNASLQELEIQAARRDAQRAEEEKEAKHKLEMEKLELERQKAIFEARKLRLSSEDESTNNASRTRRLKDESDDDLNEKKGGRKSP